MAGPMIMTNVMNRILHQFEHVATDSYKQLGWDYDMVAYKKAGGHQAKVNKSYVWTWGTEALF